MGRKNGRIIDHENWRRFPTLVDGWIIKVLLYFSVHILPLLAPVHFPPERCRLSSPHSEYQSNVHSNSGPEIKKKYYVDALLYNLLYSNTK